MRHKFHQQQWSGRRRKENVFYFIFYSIWWRVEMKTTLSFDNGKFSVVFCCEKEKIPCVGEHFSLLLLCIVISSLFPIVGSVSSIFLFVRKNEKLFLVRWIMGKKRRRNLKNNRGNDLQAFFLISVLGNNISL